MRFHYEKAQDAFYIRLDEAPYEESDEVGEGVILDYDKRGKLVGIEILNATKKLSSSLRSSLLKKEIILQI